MPDNERAVRGLWAAMPEKSRAILGSNQGMMSTDVAGKPSS